MIEQWGLGGALKNLQADYEEARRIYLKEHEKYDLSDLQPVLVRKDKVLIMPLPTGECSYYWIDYVTDPRYNRVLMYINRGYRPFEYRFVTHSWVVTPEEWVATCQRN